MDFLVFAAGVILIIGSLIGSVLGNMIASELYDRAPSLAEWLVERSVSRLPIGLRARYREEWLAHLDQCSGKLGKLLHAIGCMCGTKAITACNVKRTDVDTNSIENGLQKIQELNDNFRANAATGTMLISDKVFKKGAVVLERILKAIAGEQDFKDDLVGLHDFGTIIIDGERIRWSIEISSDGDCVVLPGNRYLVIGMDKDS